MERNTTKDLFAVVDENKLEKKRLFHIDFNGFQ